MGAQPSTAVLGPSCCFEASSGGAHVQNVAVIEEPVLPVPVQSRLPCKSALENALMLAEQSMGDASEESPADFGKHYRGFGAFQEALLGGDTVLIKAAWVESVYQSRGVLPRRQELPPGAAWGAEELMQCFYDPGRQTPMIIAISYSWLSQSHPDPDAFHLRTLGPLLRQFARRRGVGIESVALFIDWCSLPQPPRSEGDLASFQRALQHVSLWYAHRLTEVLLLSRVPSGEVPYRVRGWTSFEKALCHLVTPSDAVLDVGQLSPQSCAREDLARTCQAKRQPPVLPEAFGTELLCKKFSDTSDRDFLAGAYRKTFHQVMGSAEQLSYARCEWGDREVHQLAGILPLCTCLRELELQGNDISGDGVAALARVIPQCKKLVRLCLSGNPIGDHSMRELRDTWMQAGRDVVGLELEDHSRVRVVRFGVRTSPPPCAVAPPASPREPCSDLRWAAPRAPETTPQAPEDPEATPQVPEVAPVRAEAGCSQKMAQLLERQEAFESRVEAVVLQLSDNLAEAKDSLTGSLAEVVEAVASRHVPPPKTAPLDPPGCWDCWRALVAWATRGAPAQA